MKTVDWILTVASIATIFCLGGTVGSLSSSVNELEAKAQQQSVFAQTCNPGTIIRPDGSLILDAWKSFDVLVPGEPVKFARQGTPQPAAVHFGHTLPDQLKVCFESDEADASNCVPLNKLRSVAWPKSEPLQQRDMPAAVKKPTKK